MKSEHVTNVLLTVVAITLIVLTVVQTLSYRQRNKTRSVWIDGSGPDAITVDGMVTVKEIKEPVTVEIER